MALQNAGFVYTERRRYRLFGLVETGFDRLAHGERQVIRELGAVGSSPVPASTRNVTLAVKHPPDIRMIVTLDSEAQAGLAFQRPAPEPALRPPRYRRPSNDASPAGGAGAEAAPSTKTDRKTGGEG